MRKKIDRKSFSLIEVIIATLIIAVLVAVAVPIVRSSIDRGILQEGVVGMSNILVAEKLHYTEYGRYANGSEWVWASDKLDISEADLTGQYFWMGCYPPPYVNWFGQSIIIRFSPGVSYDEYTRETFMGVQLYMTEDGKVYSDNRNSGYPRPPWQ
jgi:type II secretory pathway pseudopilin PulG